MERLTNEDHKELGFVTYNGVLNPYVVPLTIGELAGMICEDYSPRNILKEVFARLAAYEDTGLEPKDIDAIQKRERGLAEMLVNVSCGCVVPYTRLAELAQAEKDGCLVVLPPNDPLTLEGLREMDGEPVWVVPLNDFEILPANYLVNAYAEQIVVDKFGAYLDFEDYGKTWLAYRRRPKELEGGIEVC